MTPRPLAGEREPAPDLIRGRGAGRDERAHGGALTRRIAPTSPTVGEANISAPTTRVYLIVL